MQAILNASWLADSYFLSGAFHLEVCVCAFVRGAGTVLDVASMRSLCIRSSAACGIHSQAASALHSA